MMKKLFAGLCIIVLLLIPAQAALACTIFVATDGETVLIGNNEDYYDRDTYVCFLPGEDGAYGYVCFGQEDAQPQGGMNEAGFFFDIVANTEPRLVPNPEGKPDYPHNKGNMLLENCGSVDAAIAFISQYSPAEYGYITMMLADRSGASATVTWDWTRDEMVVEKKDGGYTVIGYGEKMVEPMLAQGVVTVERFRDMLDAAHQGDLTLYSNIYNPNTGDIYIYNQHHYDRAVCYNLSDELEKGKHIFYIPGLFPEQPAGTYNQITLDQFFGDGALAFAAVIAAILLFALCYWLRQIIARKKNLGVVAWFYSAGMLGAAVYLVGMTFTLLHVPFIYSYGYPLFGFAASLLPWAMLTLSAVQGVCSVLLWLRKDVRVFGKILYTVSTLASLFILVAIALPGIK